MRVCQILAYVLGMFVASANSGYTFAGSTLKEGIDFNADFGRDTWHGVSQDVSDYETKSLSADHKNPDAIGDYVGAFGSGKPITEVIQEEGNSFEHIGIGGKGDYGKYTGFTDVADVLTARGSAAISSTGWYGISGGNSDFSGYSRGLQAGKVIHEKFGSDGLGSFRTLQLHVGHNEGLGEFSEQQGIKTKKGTHGEDEDDALGSHGDFSTISAEQSNFDSYEADGEHKTHFSFDQFNEDQLDQEVKGIHAEDNNEDPKIFKTHIAHVGNADDNQSGEYEKFVGHQAEDYSHGYHEYGGFNSASDGFEHTGFEGYESGFSGYKSDGSLLDVA